MGREEGKGRGELGAREGVTAVRHEGKEEVSSLGVGLGKGEAWLRESVETLSC